jgi:signal transduction histidine kinase
MTKPTGQRVDRAPAIDLVHDGVLELDADWFVRSVNLAGARLLGRDRTELLDKCLWQEFPSAVGSTVDRRCRQAMSTHHGQEFEEYVETLGAWFSIRVEPTTDGVTVVFQDVTHVRALVAERNSFVSRLIHAENRERARIAADVHDDSLQALGVVGLQLQVLRTRLAASSIDVEPLLDGLTEQIATATERLRSLLFSLETDDAEAPLAWSIRRHAAQIFDGSMTHWSVDDIDAGAELSPAERSQALRITKEALNNVRAHAQAVEVIVTIRGDEAGIEIEVADNGVASNPAIFSSAPGHRGLATMRDRADIVGGTCTYEPTSPHGCTVRIQVPRTHPWRPRVSSPRSGVLTLASSRGVR